jgi:hypothetical protein
MSRGSSQERSGSELVFGVLKTLMIGYRFWGVLSGFELAQLSGFLRTTETRLDLVLTYLAAEGLVSLDKTAGTVRLSDHGARHLLAELREVGR